MDANRGKGPRTIESIATELDVDRAVAEAETKALAATMPSDVYIDKDKVFTKYILL